MAVVIRLARFGSIHNPQYRVTVADSRRYRNGRFIEVVGFYNPVPSGKAVGLKLDLPRIQEWIVKGAQPSETVARLIAQASKAQ